MLSINFLRHGLCCVVFFKRFKSRAERHGPHALPPRNDLLDLTSANQLFGLIRNIHDLRRRYCCHTQAKLKAQVKNGDEHIALQTQHSTSNGSMTYGRKDGYWHFTDVRYIGIILTLRNIICSRHMPIWFSIIRNFRMNGVYGSPLSSFRKNTEGCGMDPCSRRRCANGIQNLQSEDLSFQERQIDMIISGSSGVAKALSWILCRWVATVMDRRSM